MAAPCSYEAGSGVVWEYCATSSEAMELAGAAQRVIGMQVHMESISAAALGAHISCAAARALAGAGTTATFLVSVSFDAHPQAAKGVVHVLQAVVSGCRLHHC